MSRTPKGNIDNCGKAMILGLLTDGKSPRVPAKLAPIPENALDPKGPHTKHPVGDGYPRVVDEFSFKH